MEERHRARLDRAPPARAHHELVALAEALDERAELPEVVGAVRIAHQDVAAADVGHGVDVRAPEPAARRLQDAGSVRERDLCGASVGAVDDQDLAVHPRLLQALLAPVDELADRQLLVERRDHDRELGLVDVVLGNEQV